MATYEIRTARVADIVTLAARIWGVDQRAIMSKSRRMEHCRPRFAVYLVAKEHGHSYPSIGKGVGKDHSSVIHGRDQAINYASRCPVYAAFIDALRELTVIVGPFIPGDLGKFAGTIVDRPAELDELEVRTPPAKEPMPAALACKKPRNRFIFDPGDKAESHTISTEDAIARGSIALAKRIAEARA